VRRTQIRGWLLIFCLHASVMTIANAYYALRGWLRVIQFVPLYASSPTARAFGAYIAGQAALETAFACLIGIGLSFTLSVDPRTRLYWRFALPGAILCQAAALLLSVLRHATLAALRPSIRPLPLPPLVRLALIFSSLGVWWFYWERSRRVIEAFPAAPGSSPSAAA